MEKYSPVEGFTLTQGRRLMLLVFAAIFCVWGVTRPNPLFIVAGVLLVPVSIFHKVSVVTEEGVFFTYRVAFYTRHDRWFFREIEAISREKAGEAGQTALRFIRGGKSRRLSFTSADAEKVAELARRENPGIRFEMKEAP